jgi:hypothetical protein
MWLLPLDIFKEIKISIVIAFEKNESEETNKALMRYLQKWGFSYIISLVAKMATYELGMMRN